MKNMQNSLPALVKNHIHLTYNHLYLLDQFFHMDKKNT